MLEDMTKRSSSDLKWTWLATHEKLKRNKQQMDNIESELKKRGEKIEQEIRERFEPR